MCAHHRFFLPAAVPARDLWQRTGKEARDRPWGAGIRGPPAKRERAPRVRGARELDSPNLRKIPAGIPRGAVRRPSVACGPFFRQEAGRRAIPARRCASARLRWAPRFRAPRLHGRAADALATAGDEGRGKLRKSPGRRMRPLIRGCPNGATRPPRGGRPRPNP